MWAFDAEFAKARAERSARFAMLTRTMPNLRDAVLAELERRGWSYYQLVQALRGKRSGGKDVPPATVYEFLRGESAINSTDLGLIFDAIGLEPKRKR